MSIFTDKFREPTLRIGIIAFADPKTNGYIIQPLNDIDDRDAQIPGVTPGVSTLPGVTTGSTVYELGDYVVYICTDSGLWSHSPLQVGILLCRFPFESLGWKYEDTNKPEKDGAREYYDHIVNLLEQEEANTACFSPNRYENSRISGDHVVEGNNTFSRVSDDLIEQHAGNCAIIMNGVDSSLKESAITFDKASIAESVEEQIVNNTTVKVTKEFFSTDRGHSTKEEDRFPDRVKVTGDYAYGEVEATLNTDKQPLSVTEKRADGGLTNRSIVGALFEQSSDLHAYLPKYKSTLNFDGEVPEAPLDHRKPFDRIVSNKNWDKLPVVEGNPAVREPGDIDKVVTTTIKDAEGAKRIPVYPGNASFGFLPGGGFIVRDAWGSEIRMENGDIQLSAARNLIAVTGQDELHIVGGVLSGTAKDINVGSTEGNIDIQAGKDLNVHTTGNSTIQSDNKTTIAGVNDISIFSEKAGVAVKSEDCVITCTKEILMNAEKVFAVGTVESMIASTVAAVHCGPELTIAGSEINANGNLKLSSSGFAPGKVDGIKISCPSGGGYLDMEGHFYCKGSIATDGWIISNGSISGQSVIVAQADPEIGVYKGKQPKKLNRVFSKSKQSSDPITKTSNELLAMTKKLQLRGLLDTMFTRVGELITLVLPVFSGKHRNKQAVNQVPTIATTGGTRYIYPGKSFWNSNGCESFKKLGAAETVREERMSGVTIQGASTLKLSERKE